MSLIHPGAQRASQHRSIKLGVVLVLAAAFALGGLVTNPASAEAAGKKVVIIVGPSGSSTAKYIASARGYAAQARSYGATVYEVYSPNATWTRVKSVAQGANLLIYLGHGNGWPSPYAPFQVYTKDGLGLNATAGNGNANVKYWGEYYVDRYINLAPYAVVILNHLCYASGNSEWGSANPTKSTAMKRVDNYSNGFLRANAKAVFAEGVASVAYVIQGLFKTDKTMSEIFWSAPNATHTYYFTFRTIRYPGAAAMLDPLSPGRYYRSLVGVMALTAAKWRTG